MKNRIASTKRSLRNIVGGAATAGLNTIFQEIDPAGLERFLAYGNGNDLHTAVFQAITGTVRHLSYPGWFAEETTNSSCGYRSGYRPGVRLLVEQVNRLQQLFPGLSGIHKDLLGQIRDHEVALLKSTEGWGAVPNWLKHPEIFGATYSQAVHKMLFVLRQSLEEGCFHCCCREQLGSDHLRQSSRSINFWNGLSEAQGNPDILIFPFQFGVNHRGQSARKATEVMLQDECGLNTFAICALLLSHPERLRNRNDLRVLCPGDEYFSGTPGFFLKTPYFMSVGREVWFDTIDDSVQSVDSGSASGFIPHGLRVLKPQ